MIQDIQPSKLDNAYRTNAVPTATSLVCFIKDGAIAVRTSSEEDLQDIEHAQVPGEEMQLPTFAECDPTAGYTYLFAIDDTAWFLAREIPETLPEGCQFESVRGLRRAGTASKTLVFGATTALQLANWYRDNHFCGTCGAETRHSSTERAMVCPHCGRRIYPRIIPAVIVGVTWGDKLLHTKYVRSRNVPFYALVAGFTEIGETLEQCVAREVKEETGLDVTNIRYFKSQPWGIVDDLLAGFYCDVVGDPTIKLDESELAEGVWLERSEIQGQPDDFSLTNHMMMTFRDGNEPR